jgi:hypothetical protein
VLDYQRKLAPETWNSATTVDANAMSRSFMKNDLLEMNVPAKGIREKLDD